MAAISDSAIAGFAVGAGLSGDAVAIAVAVAIAESGGDPNNHTVSSITGDDSYGLWQINMIGAEGVDRRKRFGLQSNDQLFDPAVNARVMASMSNNGKSWTAWTTYTRGTYRMYLSRGQAAASGQTENVGITTTPVSALPSLSSVKALLNQLQSPEFWKVVGIIAVGAALVLYGVMKATGDNTLSSGTKSAIKLATKAAVVA